VGRLSIKDVVKCRCVYILGCSSAGWNPDLIASRNQNLTSHNTLVQKCWSPSRAW